ncbi:triose-phosphate isomerase [Marinobacter nanhaiticus D15-8W]|uniref:Triosephosphate isomerase n=1 Tax=Marinobacter nanhaiticus D15-8W TaxID=626887 RepID=N6X4Z4_9GAMM|nr:triose-phosphate isomerase [Marinobacter nanhaiticus]ENO16138.1 triose-phosphate isomerase [Marinobacter nanhaiticus D15-8W]BES73006.1 triose-phosphate isomerase [Marinobacter nanhaiticus D15-8W]
MRRKIVAANWKMNGSNDLAKALIGEVGKGLATLDNGVEVVIIPPALYVSRVRQLAGSEAGVGVQDIAPWSQGAYTGEISAAMAADVGCQFAIVGHSERRELFGETDAVIADKVSQGLAAELDLILCVGETLAQREAGLAVDVVSAQLKEALKSVSGSGWKHIVIAYEPVWAIGTGKTATAEDAQAVHQAMRRVLADMGAPAQEVSLLYGGSVKPDNAAELFAQPDIDGGLIGGASLKASDFLAICEAV